MAKILVKLGARLKKVKMTADKSASSPMFEVDVVKAFKRRWYILAIYVYYATLSCFQWVEYSIITNIVMRYYNVSSKMVDWTGVMFMIVWPIFVFPSSFLIDKLGLRFAALMGCFLTAIGATVKVCLVRPDSFWVVMVGQAIVSLSQLFILSLPPKLAVTWFKPNEISTVCSIGVFGMQLGSAMGFLIPPMIVEDDPNLINVGVRLSYLCWGLSLICVPACIAVVWYFPDMPAFPPSEAQAVERKLMKHVTWKTYMKSLKDLFSNKGFIIHTLAYSISYGIFSAFGTLLNQFILSYFPGAAQDAGRMGLVMILVGMSGGVLAGYILDKSHKYKETNVGIYIGTVVCLGALLFSLQMKAKYVVYVAIGVFGFFLNAYIPAGIEFASELTYPANESTTTSLMTAASQTLGVTFTLMLGEINMRWGTFWAIALQISLLIVGSILTMFVPNNLRRQAAFNKAMKFIEVPQNDPSESETV